MRISDDELSEIVREYPLESLDLCYEEARWWLERQAENMQFLVSRASSLLGFEGAYLAVLAGFWTIQRPGLPVTSTAFLIVSAVLLFSSAISFFVVQRPAPLRAGLTPMRLTKAYVNRPEREAKYLNLHEMSKSIGENAKVVDSKAAFLTAGMILLGFSMALLLGAAMVIVSLR